MASMLNRHAHAVLGGLTVALAVAAVVWTLQSASALSPTFDEPHHLATGIEWWQRGTYRLWTENPPLPKVVGALAPYLDGMRFPPDAVADPRSASPTFTWETGLQMLNRGDHPERTLMLARAGTLVFLLMTLALTFVLAGGRKRIGAAFVATALVATYPPLLGHAGLATTDLAATATVLLVLWALDRWTDGPSRGRAVALGVALGLAVLCKLTAPLVCAVAGVAWLAGRRWVRGSWTSARSDPARERTGQVALAGVTAFLVVWAGYRFSIGALDDLPAAGYLGAPLLPPIAERPGWLAWLCRLRVPAPELWHGLLFLRSHDQFGHPAYLFGQLHERGGFWNFYFVGLLLKSPLPFLSLVGTAMATRWWSREGEGTRAPGIEAWLAVLAVLALSMISTVNIGMRHVLVVVPLLAIFVGQTVTSWLARSAPPHRALTGAAIGLLLVFNVAIVDHARPELVAYFNPLAGDEPAQALIDSDLDWGQDFAILERELAARQIAEAHVGFFGIFDPCHRGAPRLLPLTPGQPETGWVVLSEQFYRSRRFFTFRRESCAGGAPYRFDAATGDRFDWLKGHQPVARLGASLRLYHLSAPP